MPHELYPILAIIFGVLTQIFGELAIEGTWFKKNKRYFTIPLILGGLVVALIMVFDKPKEPALIIQNNPLKHDTTKVTDTVIKLIGDANIAPLLALSEWSDDTTKSVVRHGNNLKTDFQVKIINNGIIYGIGFLAKSYLVKNNKLQASSRPIKDIYFGNLSNRYVYKIRINNPVKRTDSNIVAIKYYYISRQRKKVIQPTQYFLINDDEIGGCPMDLKDSVKRVFH